MPTNRSNAPLTVLHLVQPVDGGVARVVVDLVRAQVAAGL
ncbi:glycosyltransferase family 1 protein, partial [Streptomyces goshikiensis]